MFRIIRNQDRSKWFGASDTKYIVGRWDTKTFQKWWIEKLGFPVHRPKTTAMLAGTYYEHSILDYIGAERKDHQIIIPELCLRVNLDGDAPAMIHEVKTYKRKRGKVFKPPREYVQQVLVQMYAKEREEGRPCKAEIISYALTDAEYDNFFLPIDPKRLKHHPIAYDPVFIGEYLRRLKILAKHIKAGTMPTMEDIENG